MLVVVCSIGRIDIDCPKQKPVRSYSRPAYLACIRAGERSALGSLSSERLLSNSFRTAGVDEACSTGLWGGKL